MLNACDKLFNGKKYHWPRNIRSKLNRLLANIKRKTGSNEASRLQLIVDLHWQDLLLICLGFGVQQIHEKSTAKPQQIHEKSSQLGSTITVWFWKFVEKLMCAIAVIRSYWVWFRTIGLVMSLSKTLSAISDFGI